MYLVYLVVGEGKSVPTISLILIAAVYGLQALVFILRRKWDMIGWMVFYILAIPAFSFLLPLYSFWRMDDFSWGATRVVLGESGKRMIVHVSCHTLHIPQFGVLMRQLTIGIGRGQIRSSLDSLEVLE